MAGRQHEEKPEVRRRRPAPTPEDRENQVIAAAYDLAEKQILEDRASSQVITHFLKLGSSRERLEQARLIADVGLAEKKIEAMESAQRVEVLYQEAMDAFRSYAGEAPLPRDDEYED